jgi:hypothetical protein
MGWGWWPTSPLDPAMLTWTYLINDVDKLPPRGGTPLFRTNAELSKIHNVKENKFP